MALKFPFYLKHLTTTQQLNRNKIMNLDGIKEHDSLNKDAGDNGWVIRLSLRNLKVLQSAWDGYCEAKMGIIFKAMVVILLFD